MSNTETLLLQYRHKKQQLSLELALMQKELELLTNVIYDVEKLVDDEKKPSNG